MEAHASLAKCYLKWQSADRAEEHLKAYYDLAKDYSKNDWVNRSLLTKV
jgi:hypothetical protein